ncbi:hypothetical protein SKAU_G00343640 [Synaphobranchus kaupii]|uniref:Uncharacterized protein n=1 Tax=Synaphobranchus kaupii TaxID=118154 RepID=A0A9Q1EJ12_SYNKA|nr:hypothetical protein SKAU_G00343640 [Synaphobranchus kaupii]
MEGAEEGGLDESQSVRSLCEMREAAGSSECARQEIPETGDKIRSWDRATLCVTRPQPSVLGAALPGVSVRGLRLQPIRSPRSARRGSRAERRAVLRACFLSEPENRGPESQSLSARLVCRSWALERRASLSADVSG